MNNELIYTDLPPKLIELNQIIYKLFDSKKIFLQNGDLGFASAPSNIALVKYWGKKDNELQLPLNSSISFTLGGFRAFTKVTVQGRIVEKSENHPSLFKHKLFLNNEKTGTKIPTKMEKIVNTILFPCTHSVALEITSENNFPTACGIASSAAGYAALIGSIADLLQLEKHFSKEELQYWLAQWARIGSGSATRSVFSIEDYFVKWNVENSASEIKKIYSDTFPIKYDSKWSNLKHLVIVLDSSEKMLSSSEGHKFVHTSPFQNIRLAGLNSKLDILEQAIAKYDFKKVQEISEEDAILMHAVMQTSSPKACYFNHDTSEIIKAFMEDRNRLQIEAFWTLDAGPNLHILYMPSATTFIEDFINNWKIKKSGHIQILKNNYSGGLMLGKSNFYEIKNKLNFTGTLA
ncbi:diphosphomevalonate decarboxylase [Pigmentibacter sp. JX0631]|uniref:diphosphomevalonate decarboxylase n=1 Tax=Pigmentibacter sp. JX0631 TaxID=2976982 RepID=UPI00246947B5|nr:diphosphomevalonate decarboxylase [Pigmentibacter sp. JX0631]WGL59097.1 diphosphomevalonate decarboxylase [Pigmentibacter sp. JX0631]